MPIQDSYDIDVDIKQKTAIKQPTVTQNDAVVFNFRVFDDGRIYNIQSGTTFTMITTRKGKPPVMTEGQATGENTVQFKLGTTELEVVGYVEAVIQVYDAEGRVSTIPFKYEVLNDPSNDYVPSEDEETLIQRVLGDGPQIIEEAEQATTNAYNAVQNVGQAIDDITSTNQSIQEAEALRVIAENEREANEDERQTNTTNAINQANTARNQADSAAQYAQTQGNFAKEQGELASQINDDIEAAEQIRQTQEQERQTNTANAIADAETATQNAQHLVDEYVHKGDYSPTAQYVKNNEVRYQGSTWRCMEDCIGITPSEGANWTLVAERGVDGTGAVSSVNQKSPDPNGNVDLTAEDVGAIPSNEKGEPNGVARLNAEGKVIDAEGNEVEGKVTSVNEQTGDVIIDVPTKTSQLENDSDFATTDEIPDVSNLANKTEFDDLQNEVTSHLAGDATGAHKATNISFVPPSGMTAINIQQAVVEAFSLGNSRKQELVDKLLLLDPSLPISYESTWEEILTATESVSSGVPYASGTVSGSGYADFQYAGSTTSEYTGFVEITDIPFVPKKMVLSCESTYKIRIIYEENVDPIYPKTFKVSNYGNGFDYNFNVNYKADVENAVVTENLIRIPIANESYFTFFWEAWG